MSEQSKLISQLRETSAYITGHDTSTGKAVILGKWPGTWHGMDKDNMAFNEVYTTSTMPPSLDGNVDIKAHESLVESEKLGLVNPNGTVLRIVDFAPGYETMLHRTQSLDYGIVLEGPMEAILESGEVQVLERGDVVVQRGTNHAWRNPSKTKWMRMIYVLQYCEDMKEGEAFLSEKLEKIERKATN
jgi:quercetin dioxygenase-like cupin family protein